MPTPIPNQNIGPLPSKGLPDEYTVSEIAKTRKAGEYSFGGRPYPPGLCLNRLTSPDIARNIYTPQLIYLLRCS